MLTKALSCLGLIAVVVSLASCGSTECNATRSLGAEPATTTVDHLAAAPGNQAQFTAKWVYSGNTSGCAFTQALPSVSWTTSDQVNTTVINQTASASTVTCLNATAQPVTITATEQGGTTATATLTCR